ncbi:hypothetical protein ACHAXR_008253, partial [Thalassiosira sp. AJA248-18]
TSSGDHDIHYGNITAADFGANITIDGETPLAIDGETPSASAKDFLLDYSCGNHRSSTCAECPQGNGAAWCNGDCEWSSENEACQLHQTPKDKDYENGGITGPKAAKINYSTSDALIACDSDSNKGTQLVSISEFYKNNCVHRFKDTVTFLHVGKGGGGTVEYSLKSNHIGVSKMHPFPNQKRIEDITKNSQPPHTLIINIRDPVDRFVSAFRWRQVVLCSPGDKRQRGGAAWNDPHNRCITAKKEELMLRENYGSNPNVLAEALCEESPLHQKAVEDYSLLMHGTPLADWLNIFIEPAVDKDYDGGIQNFIALPLENRGHFEQHIERLSLHLLQMRYGNTTSSNILKQRPKIKETTSKGKAEHSSRNHSNSSEAALSQLGECCMVKHFQSDYQLIQTMLLQTHKVLDRMNTHPIIGNACKWGDGEQQKLCRSDLESLVSRRDKYFDWSTSCSKLLR